MGSDRIETVMKNIRLLEDRVTRAVLRLRELSEEKRNLEAELESLRSELDARPEATTEEAWQLERSEMARAIETTLAELRAD